MESERLLEVLLGAYVAMLVVPAAATLGGPGPLDRPFAIALTGLALAAAVALAARSVADLPARLASLPVAAGTVLPPLAYLPYLVLVTPAGSAAALAAMIGLLAIVPGIAVPLAGTIVRNRGLRRNATEIAVVTVGDEDDDGDTNWTAVGGMVVIGVAFIIAGVAVFVDGDAEIGAVGSAFGGLWTSVLLLVHDDSSEVAVTDVGLRIDRSFTRWDDLAGYRVTDESVELVRTQRYLPDREFDRVDISDEAALIDGLGRFLPRLDGHGRVEVAAGQRPG